MQKIHGYSRFSDDSGFSNRLKVIVTRLIKERKENE